MPFCVRVQYNIIWCTTLGTTREFNVVQCKGTTTNYTTLFTAVFLKSPLLPSNASPHTKTPTTTHDEAHVPSTRRDINSSSIRHRQTSSSS